MKVVFSAIGEKIKDQDFFAVPVALTIGGKATHNTLIGGLVTIFVVFGVLVQSVFTLLDLYRTPNYN